MTSKVILLIAVVIAAFVLLVLGSWLSRKREQAREQSIVQWAARSGWSVVKDPQVPWQDRLPGGCSPDSGPRTRESGGRISLLLHGTVNDRPVAVADYSYTEYHSSSTFITDSGDTVGSSATETTNNLVVTAVRLPLPYPPLAVEPRRGWLAGGPPFRGRLGGSGSKMLGALVRLAQDKGLTEAIDQLVPSSVTLGHQPFDDKFCVVTKHPLRDYPGNNAVQDRKLAQRLLGPTLVAEHVAGRVPIWSVAGYDLISWRTGKIEPEKITADVSALVCVADLLGR
jgi:hypothetical protein